MTSGIDKANKSVICSFEDDEWNLLEWCWLQYGHMMFEDYIKDFLKNRNAQMEATHKEAMFLKYKNLTIDNKAVVDAKLDQTKVDK